MAETSAKPASARPRLGGMAIFIDRRIAVMLALGFSAGLPLLLVFDTLSAWLRESGLSLEVIGFFSLATLSYAFKFVWAPLVDRVRIPVLTAWLGQRRSWMFAAQIAIITGLWLISGSDPAENLGLVALFAVLTGFSSATQDIAMDAWRIEISEEHEQGAMVAAYTWGYRIARIVAGAVPLILAQAYSWSLSYFVMAGMMLVGVLAVLAAPREAAPIERPVPNAGIPYRPVADRVEWIVRLLILAFAALFLGSGLSGRADFIAAPFEMVGPAIKAAWTAPGTGVWIQLASVILGFALIVGAAWPIPGHRTRPGAYLAHAFGEPFKDFLVRYRGSAALIVGLICVYRLSDFTLNIMNPFYIDLGFTLTEIAEVRKVLGTVMSMLGVLAAGLAIARYGLMGPLVIGAMAGPASNLIFTWLATQGSDLWALSVAIGIDNISEGFSGTCLIAYMSSLTSTGFTATQYALFSSLYAIPGKLIGSQSGRIVEGGARAAADGSVLSPLMNFFSGLPPDALVKGAENLGVTPAALGAGYVAFFIYSASIGVIGIVLAVMVAQRRAATPQSANTP